MLSGAWHTDRRGDPAPIDSWSDVGSWAGVWEVADTDDAGNAVSGDVVFQDARNGLLRSEQPCWRRSVSRTSVVGVLDDAVLVVPRDRAREVGDLAKRLRAEGRPEADLHSRVYRPWGSFQWPDPLKPFQAL